MNLRRLRPEETDTLRGVRLQAIADAPDAFGSTYEREVQRSHDDWQRWFASGAVFVVEAAHNPVGLVAATRENVGPAPAAYLSAMWVHPTFRGTGAADELVRAVIAWAGPEGIPLIRLYVLDRNERARRLYARHGFSATGVQLVRDRDGAIELQMQRLVVSQRPIGRQRIPDIAYADPNGHA